MAWEPIVNCPEGESSWENAADPFTPRQLRALTYAGLVLPATMVHQLYFDLCSMTEQPLINAVSDMALELQELMPSLLNELTDSPPTATSSDPRVLVRAFSEPPAVGSDAEFCVHIIAVNTHARPVQVGIALQESRPTALSSSVVNVTLPFTAHEVYAQARGGMFVDSLPGGGVRVFRMGCTMPLAQEGCPDPNNQLVNPDFEWWSTLGGVAGWCASRAGFYAQDNHDQRATCHLDTRRPKHGRRCLRIVSPTANATLTLPFQGSGAGLQLMPSTNYSIRVWARSQPAGLRLTVVNGSWGESRAPAVYTQAATLATLSLTKDWQLLEAQVAPTSGNGALQLRVRGKGMLFLDDAFVGANVSVTCAGPRRVCGGGCERTAESSVRLKSDETTQVAPQWNATPLARDVLAIPTYAIVPGRTMARSSPPPPPPTHVTPQWAATPLARDVLAIPTCKMASLFRGVALFASLTCTSLPCRP